MLAILFNNFPPIFSNMARKFNFILFKGNFGSREEFEVACFFVFSHIRMTVYFRLCIHNTYIIYYSLEKFIPVSNFYYAPFIPSFD